MARRVISDEAPGRILDVQSKIGFRAEYSGGYANSSGGAIYDRAGAGATQMVLAYTPPVDCWWDLRGHIGIVSWSTAAYGYVYGTVRLNQADLDGSIAVMQLITQHSQVQLYEGRTIQKLFKLAAGVTYTASLMLDGGSGTFTHYCGPDHLHLQGVAISR
jgi:hypothetical protein